jgi:hypothetical protein
VLNTTFNNISVIAWQSVLLVEETRVPGENHRPVTSHWQTLLYGRNTYTIRNWLICLTVTPFQAIFRNRNWLICLTPFQAIFRNYFMAFKISGGERIFTRLSNPHYLRENIRIISLFSLCRDQKDQSCLLFKITDYLGWWLIGQAVILVIMYDETFKMEVIVFTSIKQRHNVTSRWPIFSSISH